MDVDEVLIIGAGPAGMAAALQLKRYGITPRLFEKARPGGLLWNANCVENYPGFPGGISGPDLVHTFLEQIKGIEITPEPVIELSWEKELFFARTPSTTYPARKVIIASGTKPCLLTGFPIPDELRLNVIYEVAGLLNEEGKNIVIVGSSDAAFDYALNLSRKNTVIILNRGERLKCLPLLWDRAQAVRNLSYRSRTIVTRLVSQSGSGMIVECSSPQGPAEYQADYLVGAIGREPLLDFVSASVMEQAAELENRGILHLVGDVKNGIFRQTAIAVGDGIHAAMRIHQITEGSAHESDCFHR
jgi:thioredoxin reductase (NADPH)